MFKRQFIIATTNSIVIKKLVLKTKIVLKPRFTVFFSIKYSYLDSEIQVLGTQLLDSVTWEYIRKLCTGTLIQVMDQILILEYDSPQGLQST